MCYITLIFGLRAMGLAVIANVILMESNEYANQQNKELHKELVIAGSILMFLNFVFVSSREVGRYNTIFINIIAIVYVILFFFNVIEGFLTADHDRKQKVIVSYLKKSSAVIAIAYMVFGYLVQK